MCYFLEEAYVRGCVPDDSNRMTVWKGRKYGDGAKTRGRQESGGGAGPRRGSAGPAGQ